MKTKELWKPVTISGFTGILMGAGAMYAAQVLTADDAMADAESGDKLKEFVADDSLSFKAAFDAARAELGAGGVFSWHGKLFNTYTADEWNGMSPKDKELFAQQVKPEVSAEDVNTHDLVIDNDNSDKVVEASADFAQNTDEEVRIVKDEDLTAASVEVDEKQNVEASSSAADDVRVIGYGDIDLANGNSVTVEELEVNGQRVAVIDVDKDGVGDIAMSDLNHNNRPDDGEVIDLHTGNSIIFEDQASLDEVAADNNIMPA